MVSPRAEAGSPEGLVGAVLAQRCHLPEQLELRGDGEAGRQPDPPLRAVDAYLAVGQIEEALRRAMDASGDPDLPFVG